MESVHRVLQCESSEELKVVLLTLGVTDRIINQVAEEGKLAMEFLDSVDTEDDWIALMDRAGVTDTQLRANQIHVWQSQLRRDAVARAGSVYRLFEQCARQGRWEEALELCDQVLEVKRSILEGEMHPEIAVLLSKRAHVLEALGQHRECLEMHKQALNIRRRVYGNLHRDVAASLNNLAIAHQNLGHYALALDVHTESASIAEKIFGSRANQDVIESYHNMGVVCVTMGDYKRACTMFEEAANLQRSAHRNRDSAKEADELMNLKMALVRSGNLVMALDLLENEVLPMYLRLYGNDDQHPMVVKARVAIADVKDRMGLAEESIAILDTQLQHVRQVVGTDVDEDVLEVVERLAFAHASNRDFEEAKQWFGKALEIAQNLHRTNLHPMVANAFGNLGSVYSDNGEYARARDFYTRACDVLRTLHGDAHPQLARMLHNIAYTHVAEDNFEEAIQAFKEAVATFRRAQGVVDPVDPGDLAFTLTQLGIAYRKAGRLDEAQKTHTEALALRKRYYGANTTHSEVVESMGELVWGCLERNDYIGLLVLCVKEEYSFLAWQMALVFVSLFLLSLFVDADIMQWLMGCLFLVLCALLANVAMLVRKTTRRKQDQANTISHVAVNEDNGKGKAKAE